MNTEIHAVGDLTTWTPAEVDTAVAPIEEKIGGLVIDIILTSQDIQFIKENLERQEKGLYVRRWNRKNQDDLDRAERNLDSLREQRDALVEQAQPYRDEYLRRGGWTRAWVVLNTNGHVHNTTACSTCFPTTRFGWLPQVSGLDEAEIVAQAGSDACTICYPSAPVETAGERTLLHRSEAQEREAKAARKAALDAKRAAKVAKSLTEDGSELVVSWPTHGRHWDRAAREYVDGPYTERESFKTERAAVNWVVETLAYIRTGYTHKEVELPGVEQVIAAVARKHGKTVEEVKAEIETKVAAKVKRDRRG